MLWCRVGPREGAPGPLVWGLLLPHVVTTPLLLQAQEACGPLEIDSALSLVQSLERDLQEAKAAARDGKLKPLPGETVRADGGRHRAGHAGSHERQS